MILIVSPFLHSSSRLELQLYSPSLKIHNADNRGPIAVFSQHDQIDGKVSLDPSCYFSGRLNVAVCNLCPFQSDDGNTHWR